MAFTINQNFDLKNRRKDFARQELTVEQLKSTRDADYPDDYQVVIGGVVYIFNSKNSADATLGKWRKLSLGWSDVSDKPTIPAADTAITNAEIDEICV